MEDVFFAIFRIISFFFPIIALAWIFILYLANKGLERRVGALEGRSEREPWINIESRVPTKHGFYEVMTEEGYPRHLVTKVIRFSGDMGGIKFWRAIREGGK